MFAISIAGALLRSLARTTPSDRPHSASTAPDDDGSGYDEAAAFAEGWGVFDCGCHDDGSRRIELQRLDAPHAGAPRFRGDHEAWHHVVARSRAGSRLHAAALAAVDPVERLVIEANCGWAPGL